MSGYGNVGGENDKRHVMRFAKSLVLGLLIISVASCTTFQKQTMPEKPEKPTIDFYKTEDRYCLERDDFVDLMEYLQDLEAGYK